MPPANLPARLTPSLFDRLTAADADGRSAPEWGYDHRQMLDAVRRDLEELLNTRQLDPPAEFPEVARSVVAYGLPDLSSVGGSSIPQRDALCRVIEATIGRFEPRLTKVRVTIADAADRSALAVRFHIEAALNMDPAPEVAFETVLDLTSGRATVTQDGRGMSQTLYPYYERELIAIRQLAQEFAEQYPGAASRLMLESTRSADPHVERLIESFALLAGRVHHKLDDEFPELTDGLLNVLYPHYLAPVPSCMVVQLVADPTRTPLIDGFTIPRHTEVVTPPVNDLRCRYRTAYPVTLWPVAVTDARLQGPPWQGLRLPAGFRMPDGTAAVLRLQLECQAGAKFADLSLDALRFHLLGENHVTAELYELLLNHASQVTLVAADKPAVPRLDLTAAQALAPVGFEPDDDLFPYPPQSFPGYRLLTEFFAFPAKFWFVDLLGLGRACRAGFGTRADVLICLKRTSANLEKAVEAATFRLGCAPAVNLFEQTAEPIPVTQARYEYRVNPQADQPSGFEVYSVDEVTGVDPDAGPEPIAYRPFFDVTHPGGRGREAYWYASRRASTRENDRGTEVYLNLVDRGWDPLMPATTTLVVRTTCTNRELAAPLQRAGDQLALELKLAAPVAEVRCVRTPTLPLRPPRRRRGSYWRLLSHLSLNHLSLTDPEEGRLALQEVLRLYDFSDPESGHQRAEVHALLVDGLVGVSSRRVVGRVGEAAAAGFCRGVEVTVELDEEKYVGTGAFLFAGVLERFLALYATVNSFTQLVAKTRQGERVIKRWPPRAGDKPLL